MLRFFLWLFLLCECKSVFCSFPLSAGEYQKAIEYYELSIAALVHKLGKNHPYVQACTVKISDPKAKQVHSATD